MSSTCPTCRKPVKPREENPRFPFCSERCRMADLGRWLNEEYRIPVEDADADAGEASATAETREEED